MSENPPRRHAVKALLARLEASKPGRAWKRYNDARGNILAAGMGYFAFFSIFPAVALAFTVFGFVLRAHPELLQSITATLNANLPGFVKDAQHPNGLIPIQAPQATSLTITGIIAFVTLVLAGMGWLGAVREGIRAVFGVQEPAGNMVTTKLRDLGVLFTLGLGVAVTAVLTSVVAGAAAGIAERIGISGQGWVVQLAGFMVSVLADTALMILLLRVLSGLPVHWRDLSRGALVGGVGFSLLKLFAGTLLPRLTANPLFASIAIVVGLMIWLNLIARLTLIAAAWAANDVEEIQAKAQEANQSPGRRPPTQGPETVTMPGSAAARSGSAATMPGSAAARSGSAAARDASLPTFGTVSGDRTTLAAGAVLGATAVVVAGVLVSGIRSGIRAVTGLHRR